jgi:signal transduction histidine kinase/ActR/RegA family two-component response regulator
MRRIDLPVGSPRSGPGAGGSTRSRTAIVVAAGAMPAIALLLFAPRAVTGALTSAGYMPHAHCYLWQEDLITVHAVSDLLIGIAYVAISLTLAVLVFRARDRIPFHWMLLAFGMFIVACGLTHFMEVWTLWHPTYWLSADVKVLTAVASVGTAVALPPLVPRVVQLIEAEDTAERQRITLVQQGEQLASAQEARAKAEEADRAKDQFLAMVSHELRTPLSPILAWARMLRAGLPEDKQQAAIAAIERNAVAQAQLVEDLLDVSRIVTGKLRLDVRAVDLADVIHAAVESLRPSADAKEIKLQLVLERGGGTVRGDADRLRQVVWNLVSNAIKFTPRGGRVHVALQRMHSHLQLTVADTGAGFDPEALPFLFTRFWQGEAGTTRHHGGLGLGLSIVRHIVELHGGEVSASSEGRGRGSVFTVSLPVMPLTEAAAPPAAGEARRERAAPALLSGQTLDGVSVLVVDDEPDSNEMVSALLAAQGAEVRVAGSAEQALAILERWRPDVLISDIGMPEQDGYALIRRVRARSPEEGGRTPALALTAYARVADRVQALNAGFQAHVVKPVDPEELVAVVAAVLGLPLRAASPRSDANGGPVGSL